MQDNRKKFSRANIFEAALLVLILSLAAYTRLSEIDLAQYGADEAGFMYYVHQFLTTGAIPQIGNFSTIGTHNFPLTLYIFSLPMLLAEDPVLVSAFMGAVNLAAVALCYWLVRGRFGRWAALGAAALYAVNPTAVFFSRKIWNPELLPLFSALALLSLSHYLMGRSRWWAAVAIVAVGFMIQLHPFEVYYLPLLVFTLWAAGRKPSWGALVIGGTLVLLPALPYLYWQTQHALYDLRAASEAMSHQATWDDLSLRHTFNAVAGTHYEVLFPDLGQSGNLAEIALLYSSRVLGALFLIATLVLLGDAIYAWLKGRRSEAIFNLLVLGWVYLPTMLSVRHSFALHYHYYVGMYPAPFVIIAGAIAKLRSWARAFTLQRPHSFFSTSLRSASIATWLAVAGVVIAQFQGYQIFLTGIVQEGHWGVYELPLRYTLAAAQKAQQEAVPGEPIYVGVNDHMQGVFEYLITAPNTVKRFDNRHTFVLPPPDVPSALYLVHESGHASGLLTEAFKGSLLDQVLGPKNLPVYGLYRLTQQDIDRWEAQVHWKPLPFNLARVAEYRGFDVPKRIDRLSTVTATVYWRVSGRISDPRVELHSFGHLVDSQWRAWGGQDYWGYPNNVWAPGERVVQWFDVSVPDDIPAGRYWVDVGMYDQASIQRIAAYSSQDDQPIGNRVRLGPLKVPSTLTLDEVRAAGATEIGVRMGETLSLVGLKTGAPELRSGQPLEVTFYWRAEGTVDRDYTVFVHLVGLDGQLLSQHDGEPANSTYPTTLWEGNEIIADSHTLPTPETLAPGVYRLEVGMYYRPTMEHLEVRDQDGTKLGPRIAVATYAVP